MTPQLMQAIKLLQLSNLDLVAYVEAELERNPLLERAEGEDDGGEVPEANLAEDRGAAGDTGSDAPEWLETSLEGGEAIEAKLDTDLGNIYQDDHGRAASEISMADLLGQLFAYTEVFDMETRPELLLLQKTMVVVEGVARSLDPELNIWTAAEPIAREWVEANYGVAQRLREAGEGAEAFGKVLTEVPRLLDQSERTALALIIRMPELGHISREEAAALAGLAPFDDDSGQHRGQRHIAGGRGRLRRSLFAAANPG